MHRPLTVADLLPRGPHRRLGRQVLLFDRIDSTSSLLLSRAGELPDGTIAAAEFQSAGRGRHGRRWQAPRGAAVLMSALLHEPPETPLVQHAALAAAVAVAEAIESVTECRPVLRWPNDITLTGRKVGGVLAESKSLTESGGAGLPKRALVIGIGLNCLQQPGHFQGELAGKATSIQIGSSAPVHRAPLAAAILERLDDWVAVLTRGPAGVSSLLAAWLARCEDIGTRVRLRSDARDYEGTILALTPEGDLLVELDRGGRRCFGPATTTRLW